VIAEVLMSPNGMHGPMMQGEPPRYIPRYMSWCTTMSKGCGVAVMAWL